MKKEDIPKVIRPTHEVAAAVAAKLNPEAFIGNEDMGLVKSAGITSKEEIAWIAKIKSNDTGWSASRLDLQAEDAGKTTAPLKEAFGRVKSALEGQRLNAYGLIRLHLMLQRDINVRGINNISQSTEGYINRFWKAVAPVMDLQVWKGNMFNTEIVEKDIVNPYWKAQTAQEKMMILGRLINVFHYGGSPFGLDIFGGFHAPTEQKWDGQDFERYKDSAKLFLKRLNNLGHQEEGEFKDEGWL